MVCSKCQQNGHNSRTCKNASPLSIPSQVAASPLPPLPSLPPSPVCRMKRPVVAKKQSSEQSVAISPNQNDRELDEKETIDDKKEEYKGQQEGMYNYIMGKIISVAESIGVERADGDGRIDSAMKEKPFLEEMKRILQEEHPDWDITISPPRASCDIMINSIRINLKLTDCKTADNSVNKPSIFYSITGDANYPYASNWNEFLDRLSEAKAHNHIKQERDKATEYHYLVKNKRTGEVLLKPIFDIHTYVSNPSNDLQINWKNEFEHLEYHTEDADYPKKVHSLLVCIQTSVREMMERTRRFAEADMASFI